MRDTKVSIITPLYNCETYIENTIQSVLAQTFKNWEMVIVDDCSEDNSFRIAQKFAKKDERIKIVQLVKNSGPAVARNKAIELAEGRYLAFLDSDDLWEPSFISRSIDFLKENDCQFSFASYYRVNKKLEPVHEPFVVPEKVNYADLLKTCPISCLTAFIDISEIGKMYMANINKRQDYALWLEYLKVIPFAYGIKEPLAKYRIRNSSVSSNKRGAAYYQFLVYYKHQGFGFMKSLYYLANWAYNGFKKYKNIER